MRRFRLYIRKNVRRNPLIHGTAKLEKIQAITDLEIHSHDFGPNEYIQSMQRII